MNDDFIVTVHVVIDTVMQALDHRSHRLAHISDAEVLTVAVVAARYFQNHHERALRTVQRLGYLSGKLATSRFNRRLRALGAWFRLILETLGAQGESYLIDSLRPSRSVAGRVPVAVARCAGRSTAATAPPRASGSSAGVCI